MKVPLKRYTFEIAKIRKWVETRCEGKVLNLFAGRVELNVDEIRNDIRKEMPAQYHKDALEFIQTWRKENFDTIILDSPYSYRKSMEMYDGAIRSPFKAVKDLIPSILNNWGRVITFGYHSISMGKNRGFDQEEILLINHGGAIHDTIAIVEQIKRNV